MPSEVQKNFDSKIKPRNKKIVIMKKFDFNNIAIVSSDFPSNCDSSGSEGSGCDCDSPN